MPVLSHTAHTLRSEGMDASEDGTGRGTPIIMSTTGAGYWQEGAGTLRARGQESHEHIIAQTVTAEMYRSGGATAGNNGEPRNVIAVNMRGREGGAMPEPAEVASVRAASGGSSRSLVATTRLRRLSPLETERLQGFPDHWTAIDYRRRRISPAMARYLIGHGLHAEFDARLRGAKTWITRVANDTVRYRAVGNSMAVPVLDYLLKRIREVDQLMGGKR